MDAELVAALRHELLKGLVDEEYPDLRIVGATIEPEGGCLAVGVDFTDNSQHAHFDRPFDDVDLQMLTEATPSETAAAIATWVRLELLEYISELIVAGRWR
jgi:hypothetical protein